jgi:hypothetical protein
MYRPTVRYDDIFREYVDSLFHATHLDRNQIIRAALFMAVHSKKFQNLMNEYKKIEVSFPPPLWDIDQHRYWMEQSPGIKERGKDVNVEHGGTKKTENVIGDYEPERRSAENEQYRCEQSETRRSREISSQRIVTKGKGGIKITINKTR